LNPLQSDFKYPSDFGKGVSDSDSDSESLTSLLNALIMQKSYLAW